MLNTSDLGTARLGKLLLQYSIPAIIGTTAASFYNIIDRIFIGHGVGPLAISGLALTLPIMNLSIAFGALIGVGSSTLVSIRMGEKKNDAATEILGSAVILNTGMSLVFTVLTLLFLDQLLYIFGASKLTLPYAKEFMQIILAGSIVNFNYFGLNNIMRASGYPKKAMAATLLTVGINLILAPLFIFWLGWGIRGAATATVCAQSVGMVWVILHFMSKKSSVHFKRGYFRLKTVVIKEIFSIGMSTSILHVCACIIMIIMNVSLAKYGGDYAIGAFGILNGIAGLFVMIVIGLNQGMQPIAGYNFGARQNARVISVFKYTVIAATCVTTAGFLLAELVPHLLAGAFTSNDQLIGLAVTGLRIDLMMFPIAGFQIVATTFFQSIGMAKISVFMSLSRQVIFLIPALLILPHFMGLSGVWAAAPVADLISSVITFFLYRWQLKKMV